MADEKKSDVIRAPEADKGEAPHAVTSVTENVTHPADASSAPGPYEGLEVNREGVSTNQAPGYIAQSLVAGAGAPQPPTDDELPLPEDQKAESKPLTAEQKKDAEQMEDPAAKDKK